MTKITATQAASVFPTYSPEDVRKALLNHDEIALIDVREEDPFAQEHPLWAANFPLSKLEIEAWARIPRRDTLIVVYGEYAGTDLAPRAAAVLRELGYTRVHLLEGGLRAWIDGGGEVFRDVNVPSKSFGEVVEARRHTPSLAAEEVQALIDTKADVVIVDARRFDEYQTMSIIGTQSLVNAGIPNPVAALRNGTIGWTLAGQQLDHGASRRAPAAVSDANRDSACRGAREIADRAGVRRIALAQIETLQQPGRTVYRFDVRTPEEFADSHLPGFVNAPGGQLVQETDHSAPVRGARIVLADDDDVRASMTGSWLAQMGWDVWVVEPATAAERSETGAVSAPVPASAPVSTVTAAELAKWIDAGDGSTAVLDFTTSANYVKRHIPGAYFVIRAQLADALPRIPQPRRYVLTCGSSLLARFAAADLQRLTDAEVLVLEGGTQAWIAAGLPLESGETRLASERTDRYRRPYEGTDNPREAMQGYLDWEFGLIAQLERDGTHGFRVA